MSSATQGCSKKGPQKGTWPVFSDNHCNFLTGSLLTPRAFLGDVTVSGLQFLLHTAWQADPGQRPLLASLESSPVAMGTDGVVFLSGTSMCFCPIFLSLLPVSSKSQSLPTPDGDSGPSLVHSLTQYPQEVFWPSLMVISACRDLIGFIHFPKLAPGQAVLRTEASQPGSRGEPGFIKLSGGGDSSKKGMLATEGSIQDPQEWAFQMWSVLGTSEQPTSKD